MYWGKLILYYSRSPRFLTINILILKRLTRKEMWKTINLLNHCKIYLKLILIMIILRGKMITSRMKLRRKIKISLNNNRVLLKT